MSYRHSLAAATVAALILSGAAQAQCPVTALCYFGVDATGSAGSRATNVNAAVARNQFFANLVGVGTEDFESRSGSAPLSLVFVGAGTATLSGSGSVVGQGAGTNGFGRYPTSGVNYWETMSASGGGTTFSVDFTDPVAAFGFYSTDVGDFLSQLSLVFHMTNSSTLTWQLPYSAGSVLDGNIMYAGFISTGLEFTGVEFRGTDSDDYFAFDDMTVGSLEQVVTSPEPASLVLMATGFAGIVAFARRRLNS